MKIRTVLPIHLHQKMKLGSKFYSITFANVTKFCFTDSLTKFIYMSEMHYDLEINENDLVSFSFKVNIQCNK